MSNAFAILADAQRLLKTEDTVRRGNMTADQLRAAAVTLQSTISKFLEGLPK